MSYRNNELQKQSVTETKRYRTKALQKQSVTETKRYRNKALQTQSVTETKRYRNKALQKQRVTLRSSSVSSWHSNGVGPIDTLVSKLVCKCRLIMTSVQSRNVSRKKVHLKCVAQTHVTCQSAVHVFSSISNQALWQVSKTKHVMRPPAMLSLCILNKTYI
jgi:hypothetical protein